MSKHHFSIELIDRESQYSELPDFSPAKISSYGTNDIMINGTRISKGNSVILKENDLISVAIPSRVKLFKFTYHTSPYKIIPSSCSIHQKYHVANNIGMGGCAEVRKAYLRKPFTVNNQTVFFPYAIKIILKEINANSFTKDEHETYANKLRSEVEIMRNLDNNHHVIGLVDSFETLKHLIIVIPFMAGGDLLPRITKYYPNRTHMSETEAKFFFLQLMKGLEYLHNEKKITHRDIKPDNILLSDYSEYPLLKISDFGLSKMRAEMNTVCGTNLYAAPEIIRNVPNYSNKVDIWSSGVVLYAMLSGRIPFKGKDMNNKIVTADYSFEPNSIWNYVRFFSSFQRYHSNYFPFTYRFHLRLKLLLIACFNLKQKIATR